MILQFALIVLTANLLAVAFDHGRPFSKYYGLASLEGDEAVTGAMPYGRKGALLA